MLLRFVRRLSALPSLTLVFTNYAFDELDPAFILPVLILRPLHQNQPQYQEYILIIG